MQNSANIFIKFGTYCKVRGDISCRDIISALGLCVYS